MPRGLQSLAGSVARPYDRGDRTAHFSHESTAPTPPSPPARTPVRVLPLGLMQLQLQRALSQDSHPFRQLPPHPKKGSTCGRAVASTPGALCGVVLSSLMQVLAVSLSHHYRPVADTVH